MKNQHKLLLALIFIIIISVSFVTVSATSSIGSSLKGLLGGWGAYIFKDDSQYVIPGWDAVEPWELQQCEQKLSSQIDGLHEANEPSTTDPYLFGVTVTLQATQRSNDYETDYYENEVAWYIESVDKNISFTISVVSPTDGESVVVEQRKSEQGNGDAGYYAWVGHKVLSSARINYEGNYFEVPVVQEVGYNE